MHKGKKTLWVRICLIALGTVSNLWGIVFCLTATTASVVSASAEFQDDFEFFDSGLWSAYQYNDAAPPVVSNSVITLRANEIGSSRSVLLSQNNGVNPFLDALDIRFSGISLSGDPGLNENDFYAVVGRSDYDFPARYRWDGNQFDENAGALAFRIGLTSSGYRLQVADWGVDGRGIIGQYPMSQMPQDIVWKIDGTGSSGRWSIELVGAIFGNGDNYVSGTFSNFNAEYFSSNDVSRLAWGALSSGSSVAGDTVVTLDQIGIETVGDPVEPMIGTILFYKNYTLAELPGELSTLQSEGFNSITLGNYQWSSDQIDDGSYRNTEEFQKLICVMDYCETNEIRVFYLHKGQLYFPSNGDPILDNPTEARFNDPSDFAHSFIPYYEAFSDYSCVEGIILGNEINDRLCLLVTNFWSEPYLEGFQDYMMGKHGSVSAINEFWYEEISTPEDIQIFTPGSNELAELQAIYPEIDNDNFFRKFWQSKYNNKPDFYLEQERYVRNVFDAYYSSIITNDLVPVFGSNLVYGTKINSANPYLQREVSGYTMTCWDHTIAKVPPSDMQILADTVQYVTGRPLYDGERHLYHDNHNYRTTTNNLPYMIFSDFLAGQWMQTGYSWSGWTEPDTLELHLTAVSTYLNARRLAPVLHALADRSNALVGVLVNEKNYGYSRMENTINCPEPGGAVKGYAYAAALGHPWRYVLDIDISNRNVPPYLVVDADYLTEDFLDRLLALDDSRTLIFIGGVPEKNEYGLQLPLSKRILLVNRSLSVDGWGDLSSIISPVDMPAPFQTIIENEYQAWDREAPGNWRSYVLPCPQLEMRCARIFDKMYVAVMNHSGGSSVSCAVPFAVAGVTVYDITEDDPVAVNPIENYVFDGETVTIFEMTDLPE